VTRTGTLTLNLREGETKGFQQANVLESIHTGVIHELTGLHEAKAFRLVAPEVDGTESADGAVDLGVWRRESQLHLREVPSRWESVRQGRHCSRQANYRELVWWNYGLRYMPCLLFLLRDSPCVWGSSDSEARIFSGMVHYILDHHIHRTQGDRAEQIRTVPHRVACYGTGSKHRNTNEV
jgi:hypothetical protein